MTVSSSTDRATFLGNGIATVFPLPFRFFANSDIQVWLVTNATGLLTPQTLGVHYTLTGAGEPEINGSPSSALTMFTAPTALQSLFVRRVIPLTQPTDIINQGRFLPEIHENVFDRLTMLSQQLDGSFRRSIKVSEFDPEPADIPPVAQRALKFLSFDAEGNPVATPGVAGTAGDLEMRLHDMINPVNGAAMVGYRGLSVAARLDEIKTPLVSPYSAAGNGLNNDSAAFSAFELDVTGEPVDLYGRSYVVDSIPSKNAYFNGNWIVGGNRRVALIGRSFLQDGARFNPFGGQLRGLRKALGDPFQQYTGIVFIGDSITWGTGATGTNNPDPRDRTLSDPRDFFATASFVNEFKRYIGSRYAPLASPILSNHPASSSGESVAEYQREVIMYPRYGEISVVQEPGASLTTTDFINSAVIGGGQLQLTSGNVAIDISHTITFTFTGDSFRLYFACVDSTGTSYELLVDGVSQGVFSMKAGASATSGILVDGTNNNYNDHSFSFVRNKVITIRTRRLGDGGNRIARFQAIRVIKRIVIKNQGINGTSARDYGPNNLSGSFGDGVAVEATDSFVFCQLGTNDRIVPGANQYPRGPNIFRRYLDATLDYLSADIGLILMCSPPTKDSNPANYWLAMTDIRDAIIREADLRSVDFVDNFSAFADVDINIVTTDGLHPNNFGHALIAKNIISALESA